MKKIRTTITLPMNLHRQYKAMALDQGVSFNTILLQQLGVYDQQAKREQKLLDDLYFFEQVSKMGKQIDTTAALREDRDSH